MYKLLHCFASHFTIVSVAIPAVVSAETFYVSVNGGIQTYSMGGALNPNTFSFNLYGAPFAVATGHARLFLQGGNLIRTETLDDHRPVPEYCYKPFIEFQEQEQGGVRHGSLVLDVSRELLYWSYRRSDTDWIIERANLIDASERMIVLSGREEISVMAIDPLNGSLFFGERRAGPRDYCIRRVELNSPNVSDVRCALDNRPNALYMGPVDHKAYWSDYNETMQTNTHIYRTNMDGTGLVEIVVFGAAAIGFAIDPSGQQLYWADQLQVYRTTLDTGENDPLFPINRPIFGFTATFDRTLPLAVQCRQPIDTDYDRDIDLRDFATFQNCWTGPSE